MPVSGTCALTGVGDLNYDPDASGFPFHYVLHMTITDDQIEQAPSIINVNLDGAIPDVDVNFYIGTNLVYTMPANSQGEIIDVSLQLTRTQGATVGSYPLIATQVGAIAAEEYFDVLSVPNPEPTSVAPDADPLVIPAAVTSNGTYRWVWQDLFPTGSGGLGSWVMPMNPSEMSSPFIQKNLSSKHTTAFGAKTAQAVAVIPTDEGKYHVFEGSTVGQDWTFQGFCPTEAMHDMMLKYRNLNRRLYIIDHRNRAWKVAIVDVSFSEKLRKVFNGVPTDGYDYEVTAVILDQTYYVPQGPG